MTTLVVCTALSQLFIRIIIQELMRAPDTVVVDTADSIHTELKRLAIPSIHLAPSVPSTPFDWTARDRAFRELFMQGPQLQQDFPDTTLPVWKVTALDRFSFWYSKDAMELYGMICALGFDKIITSADLNSELPWILARYSGRPTWAVKTNGFRTREWYDLFLTGNIPFEKILVSNESDKALLDKWQLGIAEIVVG